MFSDTVKMLRKNAGMKQDELARRCGVKQSAVSAWEVSDVVPRPDVLAKVADVFGVSVGYLLGTEEPDPNIDSIDLALSGEIRNMSNAEKQDVLDYILFKRQQKARQQ